jgi:hypothetical protein
MKNFHINKRIRHRLIFVVLLGYLGACSTTSDVVEKSLEEGDLVPEQALAAVDFLNEYNHHLPAPHNQLVDIDIAFERPNVLATGDSMHVQVGISTRAPELRATQFHVLVYNPGILEAASQEKLQQLASTMQSMAAQLPKGSALTIDMVNKISGIADDTTSLIVHKDDPNLVHFLRSYARVSLSGGKHHYVLMLAEHGELTRAEKQDLVDIANIFSVKSAMLSVLSVGDSPQVAFLQALCKKGQGRFSVLTERFDMASWLADELQYANAIKLRDIKLSIEGQHGATIKKVKSPLDYYLTNNVIEKTIPELIQGKSYVVLSELGIPPVLSPADNQIINVTVEYFDPDKKRYHTLRKTGEVRYVMDRNLTLNQDNDKVMRSLLILHTQAVLQDIVPVIQQKRFYQAVSMLTEHRIKLNEYAQAHTDEELLRDAEILNHYADHLYNYDEKFFQSINIWHDLSWDTRRYAENFQ